MLIFFWERVTSWNLAEFSNCSWNLLEFIDISYFWVTLLVKSVLELCNVGISMLGEVDKNELCVIWLCIFSIWIASYGYI